jgi:hypothetical protein
MAASAHIGFQDQIQKIVSDAGKNFETVRKQIKPGTNSAYPVFTSEIQIEGTTENEISRAADGWVYSTIIADSVALKDAKKICNQWKKKLSMLTDSGFLLKKFQITDSAPVLYGWRFSRPDLVVSLEVSPWSTGNDLNIIFLVFFNWE